MAGRSSFGALLREFRLAANLSQESLAERAAKSADGISALERGVNKAPQRETLGLLVDALQLEPPATGEPRSRGAAGHRAHAGRRGHGVRRRHNLPRLVTPLVGRERKLSPRSAS